MTWQIERAITRLQNGYAAKEDRHQLVYRASRAHHMASRSDASTPQTFPERVLPNRLLALHDAQGSAARAINDEVNATRDWLAGIAKQKPNTVIYARRERAAGADGKAGAYATILYTRSRPDNRFTEWVHSWFHARERALASEQLTLLESACRHIIRESQDTTWAIVPEKAESPSADELAVKTLAERFGKLSSEIEQVEQSRKLLERSREASNSREDFDELKKRCEALSGGIQDSFRDLGKRVTATAFACADNAGNTISRLSQDIKESVAQGVEQVVGNARVTAADLKLGMKVNAANMSRTLDCAAQTTQQQALLAAGTVGSALLGTCVPVREAAQTVVANVQHLIEKSGKALTEHITGEDERRERTGTFESEIERARQQPMSGVLAREPEPVVTNSLTRERKRQKKASRVQNRSSPAEQSGKRVAAPPQQQAPDLIADPGIAQKLVAERKSASPSGPASTNLKAASSKAIDIHVDIQPEDWEKAEILVATDLARAYSDSAISEQVAKFTAEPGVIAGSPEPEQQMAGGLKSRKFFGLSAKELDGESVDELQFRIMYVYLEAFDHAATNNLKELIILPFHPLNLEDAQRKKFIEAMLSTIHVQLSLYPSMRVKLIARTEDEETELKSALASTAQAL